MRTLVTTRTSSGCTSKTDGILLTATLTDVPFLNFYMFTKLQRYMKPGNTPFNKNETVITLRLTHDLIDYLRPKHSGKLCRSEAFFNLLYRMTDPVISLQSQRKASSSLSVHFNSLTQVSNGNILCSSFGQIAHSWQWAIDTTKSFIEKLVSFNVIPLCSYNERDFIVTADSGCSPETVP